MGHVSWAMCRSGEFAFSARTTGDPSRYAERAGERLSRRLGRRGPPTDARQLTDDGPGVSHVSRSSTAACFQEAAALARRFPRCACRGLPGPVSAVHADGALPARAASRCTGFTTVYGSAITVRQRRRTVTASPADSPQSHRPGAPPTSSAEMRPQRRLDPPRKMTNSDAY
jgi:hypothetical protein